MLDDYTKAEFPLDVVWPGHPSMVRLLGVIGDRVIGASYMISIGANGEAIETFGQALYFDGQGRFGSDPDRYPGMHIAPPPAKLEQILAELDAEISAAQARLDAHPDAPFEWRRADHERIAIAKEKAQRLRGD